jgi:hypothetical protein
MPGLNKFETETVAHSAAILAYIGKIACLNAGLRPSDVTTMREKGKEILGDETFPGLEAVWSDHLGAEIASYAYDILGHIESLVTETYQKLQRGDGH